MEAYINSWSIVSKQFNKQKNAKEESIFTLANGYIGMRGDGCERISSSVSKPGTFINGFYEKASISYGESAYGFAKNKQMMLNVCNAKLLEITVDNETFSPEYSEIESYHRELDMKRGIEVRKVVWITNSGKRLLIENRNLVSLSRQYMTVRECQVTPLNFDGMIIFKSILDGQNPQTEKDSEIDDPRLEEGLGDGGFEVVDLRYENLQQDTLLFMKQSAVQSGLSVACAVVEEIMGRENVSFIQKAEQLEAVYHLSVQQGKSLGICKYISYVTSQGEYQALFEQEAITKACQAKKDGFETLLKEQKEFMDSFWAKADVRIKGDDHLTQSLRFNIFQLLQSTGRDSRTSIASKGLSGEGYGGHYFWESEAYIAPVFMFSQPNIARNLLKYRYTILEKAKENARLLGHKRGALYSWRTIGGEESSAYFLAGSAQYHINSDIAFAICRYLDAVQDWEFLKKYGLEILLETARIWIDMGHYSKLKQGDFCIDGVTGPDEYTALVNNNCYTNMMAREHLWNAIKYARQMRMEEPKAYQDLCTRIGFTSEELNDFQKAANRMHIPYDEVLGIHMQDDTFLQKKFLDLEEIPKEHFPLLLHYHPLFIYRHQVCKQPDLLLAQFYLPHHFTAEDKKRAYNYYEKMATHDSSLSACIFAIMAAEIGDIDKAYDYFTQCIRTDLDDVQNNTKDGLHMANMAGAWMVIINGFAGMRARDGILYFKPALPKRLKGYEFSVRYRDSILMLSVEQQGIYYRQIAGPPVAFCHYNQEQVLSTNEELYYSWDWSRREGSTIQCGFYYKRV